LLGFVGLAAANRAHRRWVNQRSSLSAVREWRCWVYVGGRVLPGSLKRRYPTPYSSRERQGSAPVLRTTG
jgi:hypothetical protein